MPCFTPLEAVRTEGRVRVTGKGNPWLWPGKDRFSIACGQCRACRLEHSRQWALRCVHEASLNTRAIDPRTNKSVGGNGNAFITLTYDDEHLPHDHSVDVKHWQDFAKRLRKKIGPFRFFHCGEYGDETLRPHYHACIFGYDFHGDREFHKNTDGGRLFTSKLLEETWGQGFALVGEVNWQTAAYVARYCLKKASPPTSASLAVQESQVAEWVQRYQRIDEDTGEEWFVKPEYVTMSRRPGLGAGWYERFKGDVYPDDFVIHEGRRFRPPRYYDGRLEAEDPQLLETLKNKRVASAAEHKEDQTPERLATRERVFMARTKPLRRTQH